MGKRRSPPEGFIRPQWGFRPTEEIITYVEGRQERDRVSQTSVVVDGLELEIDLRATMGIENWEEAAKQARIRNVRIGVVLGELALQAFRGKGRGR